MFETFERAAARVREVWAAMSLNQKVVSGGVIAALLVASVLISMVGGASKYTVLFAQIDPKDAGAITSYLDQQKIPFKVTQGGTAIEVPSSKADRLKMELSAKGLPGSGIVGYEILDTTNFGTPDFLLKINYRRAMEGELCRTLRTLDAVEDAKVKIAIPEPTLYSETRKPTTASVTIKIKRGRSLPERSVEAVTNLIASSIEGLQPENVTVVDTRGNLLTKPNRDKVSMLSSTQMEMKMKVESYLADKVKSLLDGAFGTGKALVMVSADINFDQVEQKITSYNQAGTVPLSEQRLSVTNSGTEGGQEENTVTNYNTGSMVENIVKSPGNVKKLTVSVMLDGRDSLSTADSRGRQTTMKVPWTPAQLASLRTISENAVGYDPDRGDRLVVEYMEFSVRGETTAGGGMEVRAAIVESARTVMTGIVILAALGVFFFVVRIITNSLDPARIKIPLEADFERKKAELVKAEEEVETESEKSVMIRKIASRAIKDPEAIAKGLRTFYREK